MRVLFIILFVISNALVLAQSERFNLIKDSTYTVIELDSNLNCFYKISKYKKGGILESQIPVLDSVISSMLNEHVNPGYPFHCGIDLHDYQYFFQLVPMTDSTGNNIIWVNAFNPAITVYNRPKRKIGKEQTYFDWSEHVICASDGCGAFWDFKYNITLNKIFDLGIGGI